ncbi:hypothetical protein ADEAN_000503200 [Angomonas deanei]|uniref:Membrane transport protein n=1 Tax=Angomonas deanei TaxID=59799 RepID=A0A7G2CFA0_9TRYP|nr:hypothetical protein ADEAN_000503200 [Angomonas deanei]
MVTLKLFYTAISTVFKVVAAVVVGMVLSPFLNDREASEKGLSFIALRVLLPSMLFGNLTLDISLSLLREYYWAIVMSLVPQILGVIFAVAVRKSIDKEWRVLLVLGSTFQNGLVFPLSIVTNIKGVSWLDREAVARCEQYVFLYNLTCALGLWSIGNVMVKFHKDKLVARLRDLEEERLYLDKQRERTVRKHLRGALSDRKTRRRSCRRRERPTTSAISDINTLAAVLDTNTSNEKVMEKLEQEVESSFSSVTSEESDSTSDVARSTQSAPPSLDGEGEEEAPESLAQLHRYWYRPVRRHARPISMEKFNQLFSGEGEEAVLPSERAARKSAHRDKPPARASRRGRKKKVPLTAEQRQALYQDLLTNVPVPGVADPSSPLGGRGAFPERSAQDRTEVDVFPAQLGKTVLLSVPTDSGAPVDGGKHATSVY